jgi:nucleotide-binding universal stress UspA family protein
MVVLAAITAERENDPVVETANDLARAYDTQLHVLHTVSEEEFKSRKDSMESSGAVQGYSLSQCQESAATVANNVVRDTLDSVDATKVNTIGRVGDPVETIHEVADDLEATYVVIGGRQRSPAGKAIFGSTTQSILLESDRPVVTVMDEAQA